MTSANATNHLAWYRQTLNTYFSAEELRSLNQLSDWRALWEVVYNWLWIALAFVLVGLWPHVLTVIPALFILGGKQLGCAIIMHDTGHNALFKTPALNRFFGTWFGAAPILLDWDKYRTYHLRHHKYTGLETDPDRELTTGYPASTKSMTRKLLRDLSGITGIKAQLGVLGMHAGLIAFELGGRVHKLDQTGRTPVHVLKTFAASFWKPFLFHLLLFALFWIIGKPALYLLWIGAMLTTYNFSLRVRSIAEHSVVPQRENPMVNTRTTYANVLEQILFAPLHVNYHAEHHLCMGTPSYHLPRMHRMLKERGFYKKGNLAPGYLHVLRQATKSN